MKCAICEIREAYDLVNGYPICANCLHYRKRDCEEKKIEISAKKPPESKD
jgi:hypothetical protein